MSSTSTLLDLVFLNQIHQQHHQEQRRVVKKLLFSLNSFLILHIQGSSISGRTESKYHKEKTFETTWSVTSVVLFLLEVVCIVFMSVNY